MAILAPNKPVSLDKPFEAVHPLNEHMVQFSGSGVSKDPMVCFFYLLLRDGLPSGRVQELMLEAMDSAGQETKYSNGWTFRYAKYLVDLLSSNAPK